MCMSERMLVSLLHKGVLTATLVMSDLPSLCHALKDRRYLDSSWTRTVAAQVHEWCLFRGDTSQL